MEKTIYLPTEEELTKVMISIEANPGLKEKLYPVISKSLGGKALSSGQITRVVLSAASDYLLDEGLESHVAPWLANVVAKIVEELTKENQPVKNT